MREALRLDLLIAVCALLISAVASAASVYQTRVIADQFSATVWPYIDYSLNFEGDHASLHLTNDGLGPAVVRSARLGFGTRTLRSWFDLVSAVTSGRGRLHAHLDASTVEPGLVLRPASDLALFSVNGAGAVAALKAHLAAISVDVCYCSLLDRCWLAHFNILAGAVPTDVRSCPGRTSIDAGLPDIPHV